MTILKGEKYVSDGLEHFLPQTDFDVYDILEVADIDEDIVVSENLNLPDDEEPYESLRDLPEWLAWEWVDVVDEPIIDLLEADHRDWVHLRESYGKDIIVEIYPDNE